MAFINFMQLKYSKCDCSKDEHIVSLMLPAALLLGAVIGELGNMVVLRQTMAPFYKL